MKLPGRIKLANLPTKIEKLKLGEKFNKNIYIKRDDQTGTEISGNKVRKLEYSVKEALDQDADVLITCGGIQSNHARATAAVASRLGLKSHLVLRGNQGDNLEGNYFLSKLLGAEITFITADEYKNNRMNIMEKIKENLKDIGLRGYILPEGASNAIGSFGYFNAIKEIMEQEKQLDIKFDAIVTTVGSVGTFTGLLLGSEYYNSNIDIIGINICDSAEYFKEKTIELFYDLNVYFGNDIKVDYEDINILDGYTGLGYALSKQDEIDFITRFAQEEGIILDPVYTGKAMYGFVEELKKSTFDKYDNILFIHTGGIFGWNEFARNMIK